MADAETKRDIVRALVPGRDDHVIRLGADEIDIGVVLAAIASTSALAETVTTVGTRLKSLSRSHSLPRSGHLDRARRDR